MMTKILILFLIFLNILIFSQNIVGNYYPIESKCRLYLNIKPKNEFVLYSSNKIKMKGIIKISKEDNTTYLDFENFSSMYDNDTIYIQNSGNAMNPYWHFKECDEKFIHLAKKNNLRSIDFDKEYDLLLKKDGYNLSYSIEDLKLLPINNPITSANVNRYNNFAYYISKTKDGNSKAIYLYNEILKKFPDRVVAYLNLADSYWAIGNEYLAKENYKKYVELMKSQNKDLKKIPKEVWTRVK